VAATAGIPPFNKESFDTARTTAQKLMDENDEVRGYCIEPDQQGNARLDIYIPSKDIGTFGVPKIGIPINVLPARRIVAFGTLKQGASTSSFVGCTTGTSGIKVVDDGDSTRFGHITCDHVARFDSCFDGSGGQQSAPATCDSPGCQPVYVGDWVRSGTVDPKGTANEVDAAFIASNSVDAENVCGLCAVSTRPAAPSSVYQQPVRKCGRTTGLTCGTVTGFGCTVKVSFPACGFFDDDKQVTFQNQIRVESSIGFSSSGDSGAVVYTPAGEVVGVLFAGDEQTHQIAFVNPMDAVLRELKVSIVPTQCGAQPPCPRVPDPVQPPCPNPTRAIPPMARLNASKTATRPHRAAP